MLKIYIQILEITSRRYLFITTQELEDKYPDLTPKEREDAICKRKEQYLLMQIGVKSGEKHDGRAVQIMMIGN